MQDSLSYDELATCQPIGSHDGGCDGDMKDCGLLNIIKRLWPERWGKAG